MNEDRFQHACKVLPIFAWVLSYLPLIPILSKQYGQFGFECKTRMCIVINMNSDQTPTSRHPKDTIGLAIILIAILLIMLNVTTYLKVKVREQTY